MRGTVSLWKYMKRRRTVTLWKSPVEVKSGTSIPKEWIIWERGTPPRPREQYVARIFLFGSRRKGIRKGAGCLLRM